MRNHVHTSRPCAREAKRFDATMYGPTFRASSS
jgi:hypothetical protein